MYWAPVVLLISALRQGKNPAVTLERLKGLCGVWRSTVKRWQHYFRQFFHQQECYRRLSGLLTPPIHPDQLPAALVARFYSGSSEPEAALVNCLRTLALGP
ncbi:MAG: hypothetical protein PVI60_08460 [Desulfobacteraceae bacterium]